jgi:hypothetical protein
VKYHKHNYVLDSYVTHRDYVVETWKCQVDGCPTPYRVQRVNR